MTHVQVFFRKSLLKATFERELSSVSLPLYTNTDVISLASTANITTVVKASSIYQYSTVTLATVSQQRFCNSLILPGHTEDNAR